MIELPDMFEILRDALNRQYAAMLPSGFVVHKVAEYDPKEHTAPNLAWEKGANPEARYLVILLSDWASVPALGVTVNDALKLAIYKIEKREGTSA